MATKTYSDLLLDPRWQRKRLSVFERDGWCCVKCGESKSTLHVHHLEYSGNPWDVQLSKLQTLCEYCHAKEHPEIINNKKICLPKHRERPIYIFKSAIYSDLRVKKQIKLIFGQLEDIINSKSPVYKYSPEYHKRLIENNRQKLDEVCIIENCTIVGDGERYGDGSHGGMDNIYFK